MVVCCTALPPRPDGEYSTYAPVLQGAAVSTGMDYPWSTPVMYIAPVKQRTTSSCAAAAAANHPIPLRTSTTFRKSTAHKLRMVSSFDCCNVAINWPTKGSGFFLQSLNTLSAWDRCSLELAMSCPSNCSKALRSERNMYAVGAAIVVPSSCVPSKNGWCD